MFGFGFGPALEFGDDTLSEQLAQLNALSTEGIDVPDRALSEDTVLVKGNQFAESSRC